MPSGAGAPRALLISSELRATPHPPGWSVSAPSRRNTGRAGQAAATPRTPQTPPRSQVSTQGLEGLRCPGVSVPRAVHRPSRPPVPCRVVTVSLQATWPARHCLHLWAVVRSPQHHKPLLSARRQSVRAAQTVPLPACSRPPCPSTGPGSPGGSSPRRQWWRPWLDHATGTALAHPAVATLSGPLCPGPSFLSCCLLSGRGSLPCRPLAVHLGCSLCAGALMGRPRSSKGWASMSPGPHGRLCALPLSFVQKSECSVLMPIPALMLSRPVWSHVTALA